MVPIQLFHARISRTMGYGMAAALRHRTPNGPLHTLANFLLVANILNHGAELAAIADAVDYLMPGPRWLYVVMIGSACIYMQLVLRYARYTSVLKWLTIGLFAYICVLLIAQITWLKVIGVTPILHLDWNTASLATLAAVVAATINPYLFCRQWVEEGEASIHHRRRILADPSGQAQKALHVQINTITSISLSNIIALAITMTTAAVRHVGTDIQTPVEAANTLRSLAAHPDSIVFTLGIIATGLLTVPFLAGSPYPTDEVRHWQVGFRRHPAADHAVYRAIALATIVGIIITVGAVDPIRLVFWGTVVNGLVAVPIMAVTMHRAVRHDLKGLLAPCGSFRVLGWTSTGLMAVIVGALLWAAVTS